MVEGPVAWSKPQASELAMAEQGVSIKVIEVKRVLFSGRAQRL